MILENIKIETNEELFIRLYQTTFPSVAAFVKKMGGSLEEAKDIFQDALVIYYEKTRQMQENEILHSEQKETQYIFGIAKFLWYKAYKQSKQVNQNYTIENYAASNDEPKVSEKLLNYVELAGKKCLELLSAFYYDKLNMNEIALRFGFSGERSASTQKFKCLEKVRQVIKVRSLKKEDFYE